MFENLDWKSYSTLLNDAAQNIKQDDVTKIAETLYSVALEVYSGNCDVEENLQILLDRVEVPDNFNKETLMNQIVGIFIGLELAKHGGLDADKT